MPMSWEVEMESLRKIVNFDARCVKSKNGEL